MHPSLDLNPGPLASALDEKRAGAERALAGLWRRDPATWSADAAVQKTIANRLGWLSSPQLMADSIARLTSFADRVKHDGLTDVVLLGMGGSSLAPEVLHRIVGTKPGAPRFQMLDSTDPAAILAASTPPAATLYIIASKSGTTIEPNALAAHFRRRLGDAGVASWASHFIAITDAGTELAKRASADHYRDVFINPSDIGGRYSALSFFGLVPSALMGQNIGSIVGHGLAMLAASDPARGGIAQNPAALLGLALGTAARAGRDKLTLLLPPQLAAFGLWVEQLIAESTGKHGMGIVPVAGESRANAYGSDRIFVRISAPDAAAPPLPEGTSAPVASIELASVEEIGGEFVRWEIATAIAGALLEINPFDEPNVAQAKDATRALLDGFKKTGALPAPKAAKDLGNGISFSLSAAAAAPLEALGDDRAILELVKPHDYFGLLAYLGPAPELAAVLHDFRSAVLARTGVATMFGYGPRYLHSTGQLHKGGPDSGVFILVSATPQADVAIPSETFSFGVLEQAQALGDFSSLDAAGRRAMHLHLPAPDAGLLKQAFDSLLAALS
jgi:transaldolase / glucose-6-phosphate isomerase